MKFLLLIGVAFYLVSRFVALLERDERRRRRQARLRVIRQRRLEVELHAPKGRVEMLIRAPALVLVKGSVELLGPPALPWGYSSSRLLAHNADHTDR